MLRKHLFSSDELRRINFDLIHSIKSYAPYFPGGAPYKVTFYFFFERPVQSGLLTKRITLSPILTTYSSNCRFRILSESLMLIIPDFLLTQDNIDSASIMLNDIATSCGCIYDHWDVEINVKELI